jgi:hypothetical protein
MSGHYNQKFWVMVKGLMVKHHSDLKPCKFHEANRTLVEREYRLLNSKPINKPRLDLNVYIKMSKIHIPIFPHFSIVVSS